MSESAPHKTLAEALLAAQEEMPAVDKDGTNPHFKSSFTTLGNLLSKVRPVLNRNGLVLVQAPVITEGVPCLRTTLIHAPSSELHATDAPLSAAKNDPQGQGSAITYMRRYALASLLAIADQEDDDGNAAQSSDDAPRDTSAKVGFSSEAQEKFCRVQLGKNSVPDAGQTAICDYLKSRPRSDVFKAIDALKGESEETTAAEMVTRLNEAASKYAEIQAQKATEEVIASGGKVEA